MSDAFINQIGQSIDYLGNAAFEVVLTELDLRRCVMLHQEQMHGNKLLTTELQGWRLVKQIVIPF